MASLAGGSACFFARNGLNLLFKKYSCLKLPHKKLSALYNGNYNNRNLTNCVADNIKRESCLRPVSYGHGVGVSDVCRFFSNFTNGSSAKSKSEMKGIADEILEEQITKDKSHKEESEDEQKKKEEKAKADEFSKRLMKYSFLLFSVMFTGSAVVVVIESGEIFVIFH